MNVLFNFELFIDLSAESDWFEEVNDDEEESEEFEDEDQDDEDPFFIRFLRCINGLFEDSFNFQKLSF